ncbi:MAG TPA: CoA transferase [Burkholderiales bacterium]|nr:CoA transferase [Burkholderiales bacterium]
MTQGALDGVRVVDLSRVLAGPLCTQMLADHGADVIKVEPPAGDETRLFGPPFDAEGDAAYFAAVNRGKRALALDLSKPDGRAVVETLLAGADVLVENFLPGTMEKWGLGYDALARRHPRLVYCSISGFGADGPLGGLPGYDAVLQAMCGLMSVNGSEESGTMRLGIPIVDHLTGYAAMSGILMALVARQRTGRGQRVEATLFDTGLSLLVPHASNWFYSGRAPRLLGSAHPNICPYDKFKAGGGEIFLGVANDGQFRRLCECIGREDLAADARFQTNPSRLENRAALRVELEKTLAAREVEPLCRDLMRAGVPAGPVHTVPQAFSQAHAAHRGMLVEDGGYRGVGTPLKFSESRARAAHRPPRFGEHADEVLAEAGYRADQVAELRRNGALRDRPKRS